MEMSNIEPNNCWEFFSCSEEEREKCPAFPDDGRKCWKVGASLCGQTKSSGLLFCMQECDWYKKVISERK